MRSISVVIPTARHPDLLECALRSVARQTAVHEIEEVLVSENLGDLASRAVCDRFPKLPIRYVLQDPPLTPVQNYQYLLRESRAELIAFLCDDDWWGQGHLQAALLALDERADAVAWFSACFYSVSDMSADGWVFRPTALWLAAGKPDLTSVWVLEPSQLLSLCWILTPFHFSSMVLTRRPAMRALPAMNDIHAYQVDRLFFCELAAGGKVLYEPMPDTFARARQDNETMRVVRATRDEMFRRTTENVWAISLRRKVDLVEAWQSYLRGAEAETRNDVAAFFRRAMDDETLVKYGLGDLIPPSRLERALRRALQLGTSLILKRVNRHG